MQTQNKPILLPVLLYNDECSVCRRIGHWVQKSAQSRSGEASLIVRPIGDDPEALRSLNPDLDIWDAYETIHLLMPDGSMKLGGEAVAEVLRNLPNTRWFAASFAISLFGLRPFQMILDMAYVILSDVRPLFGCESCGMPGRWVRPFTRMLQWVQARSGASKHPKPTPHFTSLSAAGRRTLPAATVHPNNITL
jgi:predicted DCC family thiol-disulfide oxidoreductase YuxK